MKSEPEELLVEVKEQKAKIEVLGASIPLENNLNRRQ